MKLAKALISLNDSLKRTVPAYMLLVAVAVGLLCGYGAVGFRFLIQFLQEIFWSTEDYGIAWVESLPWYWVVLTPAAGGLFVGMLVQYLAREAKGHGVPEVMEAVALRNGRIRPRVVAAKALASGVCIASGGSVGREGPIVQICSAIGSTVGQVLRMGNRRVRTLVGCGAAAGIAATFNAPIAGSLFAVEVILGDFAVPQFSPIVISAVAATVISRSYLGNVPAFEIPDYSLVHPNEFGAYVVLGILAGVVAVLFSYVVCLAEDKIAGLRLPLAATACVGGGCVGAMALLFPGVMGTGYESIGEALDGSLPFKILGGLLLVKLVAVAVTLGSGGSGGIFAPSLFLGAMLGALVGGANALVFPGQVAPPGAYALVGMGAVVAGATHAPITAILIIFELTGDYEIMLPLMASCIIATLVAMRLNKESIYTLKLVRRGVNIRAGRDTRLLQGVRVQEVLREHAAVVHPHEPLDTLMSRYWSGDENCFYVVGEDGQLRGIISSTELRRAPGDSDVLGKLVIADDIAATNFPIASANDSLESVLTRLDVSYRDELPVVEDGRLVGTIRIEDIIARYRKELLKRQVAESRDSV